MSEQIDLCGKCNMYGKVNGKECYYCKELKPRKRFDPWEIILGALEFSSLLTINHFVMIHLNYSSSEMIIQGLCLGFIASKILRSK